MFDVTRTTTQLLEGLFDSSNSEAWTQFDARYRPIMIGFARSLGLSAADAADAAQEAMTQFVRDYQAGRYDRTRGRLRSWLIATTRNRVIDMQRKRGVRREWGGGDTAVGNLPDNEAHLTHVWEEEQRRVILRRAVEELKNDTRSADKTIEAFELVVFQQRSAPDVAEALGMKVQDVYLAKSRITARLREIVTRLEATFDDEGA